MIKKIFIPILCLLFSIIAKAQTIIPSQTTEVCPNTEYTFLVTLPGFCTNIFVSPTALNIPPTLTQAAFNVSSNANGTGFNFKGKFADFNNNQTFTVQYNDVNNVTKYFPFTFKKIKSLLNPNYFSQINLNTYNITSPYCQITTHNVNFVNVKYANIDDIPQGGYGNIASYEYLLPQGWKIAGITSNGTSWITGRTNNETITSDLVNGNGQYISVRASNIGCGTNLVAGQESRILISKLAPTTLISGNTDVCINSSNTYTLTNPPCNATCTWSTNIPQIVPSPTTGLTTTLTNNGSYQGSFE